MNSEMMMISFEQYVSNNIIYELIVYYHHLWACHFALPNHSRFFIHVHESAQFKFTAFERKVSELQLDGKRVTRAVKF